MKSYNLDLPSGHLSEIVDFEEKLNEYHAADNSAIKAKLGELLKNNCALVKAYHLRRKK